MKPQSQLANFVDRFVAYLKNPNPKSRAAAFGVRGSEEATRAAVKRTVRHQQLADVRRNARGLPRGIGPHQLRAAKRIKNALSCTPELARFFGETRLRAAETTLKSVKRNAAARARNPRKPKLARRLAALR